MPHQISRTFVFLLAKHLEINFGIQKRNENIFRDSIKSFREADLLKSNFIENSIRAQPWAYVLNHNLRIEYCEFRLGKLQQLSFTSENLRMKFSKSGEPFFNQLNKHLNDMAVAIIIWGKTSCVLTLRDARFRMRIALGVVRIRSLVCAKRNPGRLRSGSGVSLY